ncbi:TetR family transcriptional regulator [Nocardia bovistercoris]|uniref:TetR family transcriptional regulator n=1 Tax=Nocardia bovistercoris TaxID=2785916 RepID=A0A931IAE2_9NOCA|nr:TetR family transcriptional regulator [Nocardia bovistercoris]MBH0776238.1 TetR family transcriptional regulator [Nocardia bovistercoris]
MGNREDLLAGARKVIMERGVAKATARDIAAAAGVSLAAIGYHFGSKERLVAEALTEALGTGIGDGMDALVRGTDGMPLAQAFATMIDGLPALFAANRESMLASVENMLRAARADQPVTYLADGLAGAYADLATALRDTHPVLTADAALAIAELYFGLTQGLSVLWLIAPDTGVPDGQRFAAACLAVAGAG